MSIEKITSEDGLSQSKNLIQENIEQLKRLFPEIVTEGKIDFKSLQQVLGEEVEDEEEFFRFTWSGKSQARREAHKPSTGTLRPCKEESLDWDTTQNLYIEGDNLEVLKLLQKSYSGKIKMIYIDPPYNTGKDFVYKDNYKDNLKNYQEVTGQIDSEGNKISTNSDSDGRFHSNWLNMMYPRLRLARNLLKSDGVVFISIDDGEFNNLKKICDEIFGESNFRNTILTRRRVKSLNVQFAEDGLRTFNVGVEYILVYSKSEEFLFNDLRKKKEIKPSKGSWNVFWSGADRPTMRYEILGFTPKTGQWRWSKEKALEAEKNYKFYLENYSDKISIEEYWENTGRKLKFLRRIENGTGKNGGVQYYVGPNETTLRTSNWTDIEVSQIKKDFDLPFDNPKNVDLIKTILKTDREKDSIVLDFFSGSSTTGDAVMRLNNEDGGNRKFILVQLPEQIDNDFKTLTEIGRQRLLLSANKIKSDNPLEINKIDIGFKVLKLDSSNINSWDGNPENLESSLFDSVSNIKSDRTEEDVLYEILLKYGLDLTLPIEERDIHGKKVFNIGMGSLFICLSDDITSKVAEGIGEWKEECDPEICRVIFKDNGFTDVEKTNSVQILKRFGINEIRSI